MTADDRRRTTAPRRDSGVAWLGEVPAHWGVQRFKRAIASCRNGIWGEEPDGIHDIPCVRVADFDREALGLKPEIPTSRAVSIKDREGRTLRRGNLLLEKSGGGENQPVGQVVLYDRDEEAVCSNFIARVELTPDCLPNFWKYVFAAAYVNRINLRSVKQTSGIQNLDQDQFFDEYAPFPPLAEQQAIAAFLDGETARIDWLVDDQRRLIELLRERRAAVIAHAVTKGLDPTAPLRHSGVAWLGEVPAHWGVQRFKRAIASCRNGIWGEEPDGIHDIPCVRVADFDREALGLKPEIPTSRAVSIKDREGRTLRRGNLLLEKSGGGENQPVGQVVLYDRDEEAVCSNFIARVELTPDCLPNFWKYVFAAAYVNRINLRSVKQTSGIQNLDQDQFFDEYAPFPPLAEQQAIAAYLDGETARIDGLIADAERGIELLGERRAAVISEAVRGDLTPGPSPFVGSPH